MPENAAFLPPAPALGGTLFGAVLRDTTGLALAEVERFNHFPASPLVSLTRVFRGETRLVPPGGDLAAARAAPSLPPLSLTGPQSRPLTSWNPGPVTALSVAFYPDAWARLFGAAPADLADRTTADLPAALTRLLDTLPQTDDPATFWAGLQAGLAPDPSAAPRLGDWARTLVARAALSGPGRSLRATERRLRRWTGQSRQSLAFFSSIENLHALATRDPGIAPAALAQDAGYADQSHMGRAVRRATGFSPARLNRLIESHPSFWCYRLLGERF